MRYLTTVLTVLLLIGGEAPVSGASREECVRLISTDGKPLSREGWELAGVSSSEQRIVLEFRFRDEWNLRVAIEPKDPGRLFYAATTNLAISYQDLGFKPDSRVSAEIDAFMKELVAVVRNHDDGNTFQRPKDAAARPEKAVTPAAGAGGQSPQGFALGGGLVRLDFLLFLFLLVSLAFVGMVVVKDAKEWDRKELLPVAAILALGIVVRLFMAPHELVKVGMAYPLMDSAVSLETLPRYGSAAPVLYHLLFQFLPIHVDTILYFHTFLSVLNAVLVLVFARRYVQLKYSSVALALFLCLTPVFVRDANSESILVPGMFLLFSGGLLVQEYLRNGKLYVLFSALPALALALHLRPEFLLVVPLFLAMVVIPGFRRDRSMLWIGALFAALVVLTLPYISFFNQVLAAEIERGNIGEDKLNAAAMVLQLFQRNLLVSPGMFPMVITLLAGLGVALSAYRKQHLKQVLSLLVLGVAWLTVYYVDFNEESMLRLQVPPAVILSIVASYGMAMLLDRFRRFMVKAALGILVLAAFLFSATLNWLDLFFVSNSQQHDAVFDELVECLPDESVNFVVLTGREEPYHAWPHDTIASATPDFEGTAMVHRHIPEYLLKPPLRQDRLMSISEFVAEPSREGRNLFYLSPHCYAVRENHGEEKWGIKPDPYLKIHPACRYMLTRFHLEPIKLVWMHNEFEYSPPFRWYPEDTQGMTVGLLEVVGTVDGEPARNTLAGLAGYYFAKAKTHLMKRDLDKALEVLEEGQRALGDNSVTMWHHLADYFFLAGATNKDKDSLKTAFDFWVLIADKDVRYQNLLKSFSSAYSVYSEYLTNEEVLSFVEQRLKNRSDDVVGLMLKGMLLFYNKKDYEGSLACLEPILDHIDDDPRVYVYISLNHFYLGRQAEAEKWVEKAIEVCEGTDPDAYYVRSIICRGKNLPQAIADIEKYLEMSKGDDKVKYEKKQQWLKQEVENLKNGKMSPWWRTKGADDEPWKE